MAASRTDEQYTARDIQVLEGLEAVRRRPGMYIGGTDQRGLHHLVIEIVNNSIDEAMAGRCDHVWVHIARDGRVTVRDNGWGIPIDTHPGTGKSALETVMTVLHAGGKFGGNAYKVSGGLHGVGASVVNALSENMWVEVRRNGKLYRQEYERQVFVIELGRIQKLRVYIPGKAFTPIVAIAQGAAEITQRQCGGIEVVFLGIVYFVQQDRLTGREIEVKMIQKFHADDKLDGDGDIHDVDFRKLTEVD